MDKGALFGRRRGVLAAFIMSSVFAAAAVADAAPQRPSSSGPGSEPAALTTTPAGRPAPCRKGSHLSKGRCVARTVTRQLTATINCPLPGPNQAIHCVNVPLAGELFNSCDEAVVTILPGSTFQFMVQVTVDPVADSITFFTRSNFQNVAGLGTDGSKYQANDTQSETTKLFPLVGTTTIDETLHENQELISLNPKLPNQIIHEQVHTVITFGSTPTITVETKGPGLKCTG